LRKSFLVGAATAVLALASFAPALAQNTITFAQFQQGSTPPANPFTFSNAGAGSTFSVSGSIPVNFTYQVASNTYFGGTPVGVVIPALMTFNAMVSGPATSAGGFDFQGLQLTNMTFTAVVPWLGKSNLLSLINSTGVLQGKDLGNTAGFAGDSATGDIVNFTSDFLPSFAGAMSQNYSLSFSSVKPTLKIAGNGYLRTFTASGTGTFAEVTPEAGSLALLSFGVLPLVALKLRNRKKA
jgi:hypothetical protein